ncbi:MAG: alpha/beta fold hydrolase [Phycisphaerales bacterium]|nr:alpha/beta fold hydrolase [Phycisphaerales bacterium]
MPILGELPNSLKRNATHLRLGEDVPAMVIDVEEPSGRSPLFLWIHGRTTHKELDAGRYLRLMRRGIACCALDLPGHGERHEPELHEPDRVLEVIEQMVDELDPVLEELAAMNAFDFDRLAIGGISAGGIVALLRLTREHPFAAAAVEATTGNRAFSSAIAFPEPERLERINVIDHLENWREVPLLALHNRHDEWIKAEGQEAFIAALRKHYRDPAQVEFHVYEDLSGAPHEHAGFGRFAADAKERQVGFLERILRPAT